MYRHHSRRRHAPKPLKEKFFHDLFETVWGPPHESCPKCKGEKTEYYDPFFFAPLRTLLGKRRIKCSECGFIWRPSRTRRSLLRRFNQSM
ncbi:MAG: hypothetical protein JXA18_07560 [Chitinispirillaceae bacterium]|nr:hypothetical protein [Chitinispirillaceae bacterium]